MSNEELQTILYVEDEADIREIAKIALEEVGKFKVFYCSNGKELVEKAPDLKPELLLLDVMMPEMDGPTALQEVRKLPYYQNIPVIFMTAKIQPEEIARYQGMRAVDVITKPFDPMNLSELIRSIWKKHRLMQHS